MAFLHLRHGAGLRFVNYKILKIKKDEYLEDF
jgi:hypothetical protein